MKLVVTSGKAESLAVESISLSFAKESHKLQGTHCIFPGRTVACTGLFGLDKKIFAIFDKRNHAYILSRAQVAAVDGKETIFD